MHYLNQKDSIEVYDLMKLDNKIPITFHQGAKFGQPSPDKKIGLNIAVRIINLLLNKKEYLLVGMTSRQIHDFSSIYNILQNLYTILT